MEEISLRILSSLHGPVGELETVGSSTTSQAMAGERMNIFSHAKALSSNQDLLGLGTVDFRNAALIRDSGDENSDRPGKGRGQNIKGRGWSKSLDILPPRMSVLHSGAGPSTKEDSALFASSDAFDPKKYLGNVHKGSSLEDLRRGLSFLKKQLNEGKDQRMLLVKENFERFIKCKNTIDDIHAKLQHNELHSSSEAASTVLLMQSLSDVKDKSNSIFQPLIERQHERENLQSLLSTFRRYQWFLEMPTTLETHLNNRKNDQVVSCYKKSKIFMEEVRPVFGQSSVNLKPWLSSLPLPPSLADLTLIFLSFQLQWRARARRTQTSSSSQKSFTRLRGSSPVTRTSCTGTWRGARSTWRRPRSSSPL